MDPFTQAISKIISEQESIIGPLAIDQARKVEGLEIAEDKSVKISGNKKEVLNKLVSQYAKLFGPASVQVCREAFQPYSDKITPSDIPDLLKSN